MDAFFILEPFPFPISFVVVYPFFQHLTNVIVVVLDVTVAPPEKTYGDECGDDDESTSTSQTGF